MVALLRDIGRMKDGLEGDTWSFELRPMEIGVDRNGSAIMAAYVVLTDFPARREPPGPTPSAAKRPSPQGAKFLEALREVIAGPVSVTRESRRCATMANWKAECVARGLLDYPATSNSSRARVSKYRTELVTRGLIACDDGLIWAI
jgi:hypothetical protein